MAIVVFILIIVIFFATAFVFLFFLVWLLSKEEIGRCRPIRRIGVKVFWTYSAPATSLC